MGFAVSPSICTKSMALQCLSSPQSERFSVATLSLPRTPLSFSGLLSSRARNLSSAIAAASSSRKKKKKVNYLLPYFPVSPPQLQNLSHNHVKGGDEEEDAFELLFKQLEEDLKNDDMSLDDNDDEISEEDLAMLERELEEALGQDDPEMLNSILNDTEIDSDVNNKEEEEEEEDDDDKDGRSANLRNWQLRKLAKALKAGRRRTSIKSLAAELCLDRAVVLELLRNPPPNLLMMSLSLPDEPKARVIEPETQPTETVHEEIRSDHVEPESKAKVPVHVMQHRWSAQKRLKRVHVDTLERIYKRTKRPTNAMISSIVHVTNLPRRRVVKWFEDKRAEDDVPEDRIPYLRSVPEEAV
ncbi:protein OVEREXPRESSOR OF CATIONIC PEROXIDASE 3 [Senna tora]|uniref:Protein OVEREXPRESSOR OF CATIONIC PEROXIDASE 3 n=1 Tax=Senna tora TaxID=362788 RepID=A0A834U157_9FABA|nr:protein OVEREXPRESSOR OF CATIONIC PEROXIDASE 3 [Senna tora]